MVTSDDPSKIEHVTELWKFKKMFLKPWALSPGLKMPGREATPPLLYVFMVWCLVKHKDNFTFTF